MLLLPASVTIFAAPARDGKSAFTLVIDAGHGGNDPGAVGRKAKEKTINLNVALALGKMINNAFPEVNVIYTRKTDKRVSLMDRAAIANRA
ncbi:MAG: N-acetylmuramoyl-L-alanine amidase, partial [Bacteroidaceae bacterium]|nr:N-acetylmuramoyl-L-alanine amidase [Bacteroidaceae bacterium]